MDHGHGRRTGTILGVAAGGLLVGHWLTYLLEVPDAHARAGVLAASGHGYLGMAAQISAIVAAACIAMVFLGRLTRRDPGLPFGSTATRLAVVQGSAFVAMEVLERLGAGAHLHDLTSVLPVGLAAQALIAIAGTWVLRWVLRAADAAGSFATALAVNPRGPIVVLGTHTVAFPPMPIVGTIGARGPPGSS
jgi:hypothetical protein